MRSNKVFTCELSQQQSQAFVDATLAPFIVPTQACANKFQILLIGLSCDFQQSPYAVKN